MKLLDREREWMRPRRMAEWDALGGPSRRLRWMHRNRVAVSLLVTAAIVGVQLVSNAPLRLWWFAAPPMLWWYLRTDAAIAEEWRARGPRPTDHGQHRSLPTGWFERASTRQQLRTDDENRLHQEGRWEEHVSPITDRVFSIWAAWAGAWLVLAIGLAVAQALFG